MRPIHPSVRRYWIEWELDARDYHPDVGVLVLEVDFQTNPAVTPVIRSGGFEKPELPFLLDEMARIGREYSKNELHNLIGKIRIVPCVVQRSEKKEKRPEVLPVETETIPDFGTF